MVNRIKIARCHEGRIKRQSVVAICQCAGLVVERIELARALAAANRPSQPDAASAAGTRSYTVRSGDSLHSIARRHQCSVEQLARGNGVRAPRYLIKPGQRLQLVGCRRP
jgi:membrane-bound lytic murein transglycosylase D